MKKKEEVEAKMKAKVKKPSLKQFGYSSKIDEASRKKALKKAVKSMGLGDVTKLLNVAILLNKKTNPKSYDIFVKDLQNLKE